MNISQIRYFLEVAKCQNLTKAAHILHVTQPTLGRQISVIESEVNALLFIRTNKGLELTPAGIVLYEEFSRIIEDYDRAVDKAFLASQCITGKLNIGILDGLEIQNYIPEVVAYFEKTHPNIEIIIKRKSFLDLLDELIVGKLDASISFTFHIKERSELDSIFIKKSIPAFVVPLTNPLSEKKSLQFTDFKDEPLAIVNKEECPSGVELIINTFLKNTGFYPKLHFLESMADTVLWVESGMRCAVLNMDMNLKRSDTIKMYPIEDDTELLNIELAFRGDNNNFALNLLKNFYAKKA